ncbi:MAG TPA: hypothetical protein VF798_03675, partial [Burkholderiaceae bacterium]
AANGHATVARRVHDYRTADGELRRVLDPWRPLAGCLFLRSSHGKVLWPLDEKSSYNPAIGLLCGRPALTIQDGVVPSGLNPLIRRLDNQWRAPLARDAAVPMNQIDRDGVTIPQGAHVELTLDASLQASAQSMADCMTGHMDACSSAGLPEETWPQNVEGAAARMFGVAIVDVKTGAVEALASAHSPCYEAEHGGRTLPPHCPTPALERERPLAGKLDHHAFADAKPASLVKPIMAIAFMRDPVLGAKLRSPGSAIRKSLLEELKNSDSPDFLDRAFCRDTGFSGCTRLARIADVAGDLGWNVESADLLALTKQASDRQTAYRMTPRFMQMPGRDAAWHAMPVRYDAEQARRCAIDKRWSKCDGDIANVASELLGQGNAVASPLTIADMLRRIAAAANGVHEQPSLHLLQSISGKVAGEPRTLAADTARTPVRVGKQEADFVLAGMSQTHRGGTATSGCAEAYRDTGDAIRACRRLTGVAGKTGTPGFADEAYSWDERAQACHDIGRRLSETPAGSAQRRALERERGRCVQTPFKWYAAVVRDKPAAAAGPWTRVVVVLAERNYRNDGWIDAKGDVGANIAAELGFRLIRNF